jgi:hypothetical protein
MIFVKSLSCTQAVYPSTHQIRSADRRGSVQIPAQNPTCLQQGRRLTLATGRFGCRYAGIVSYSAGRDRNPSAQCSRCTFWIAELVSATPFVPPRFLKRKGRNTLEGQIVAELSSRGFPHPTNLEIQTSQRQDAARSLRHSFATAALE